MKNALPEWLNLARPLIFLMVWVFFTLVVIVRYFLFVGVFNLIFEREIWKQKKINKKDLYEGQKKDELKYSMISSVMFGFWGTVGLLVWQLGYSNIYVDPLEKGWLYLPVSFVLSMVIHETYYYFLHVWMHKPKVFMIVHKVHHDSLVTTPYTAFSFHPIEAFLQAPGLIAVFLFLPMHYSVILAHLVVMTFLSIVDHLNIEIYSQKFYDTWFGKQIIGATHHEKHHKFFRVNYGLYFTLWDKIRRTEK